ncbi:MAG TPA: hypothetical protein VGF45_20135 [Polyangia bacterium]
MLVAAAAAREVSLVTRYAALRRWQALLVMAALVCLGVWFQFGAASPEAQSPVAPTDRPVMADKDLYRAVIARVRNGEDYYAAAAHELRTRGYPIKPALNFRQPTYAWLLSRLPDLAWANWIQAALALLAVVLTHRWLRASVGARLAWRGAGLTAIAFVGVKNAEFPMFQESWAGLFIFLSLCAFALGHWRWGLVATFAALSFRELALLPCGVGVLLALRNRRWREAGLWVAGITVYAVLMHFHAAEASQYFRPEDRPRSWVGWGGAPFLIKSMQFSALMAALPRWVVALAIPLSMFGLIGWRDRGGERLTLVCVGYVAAFVVIGLPFNNYWGPIYAPLVYLGLALVPDSLRDLVRAARSSSFVVSQPLTVTAERT